MSRKLFISAVALLLLIPGQLMAGGLPRLCVPIDGVTADNAKVCAKLIADGLEDKRGSRRAVEIQPHEGQWYAMFHFNVEHLKLSDIDAALKDSGFSVPRDRLHLFGRVTLVVEVDTTVTDRLNSDLAELKYVKVDESKCEQDVLLVTLIMPYDWTRDIFKARSSSASVSTKAGVPATAHTLPSYDALRGAVAKHKASLKDIRWNCWGCRMIGCLAVPDTDAGCLSNP